MTSLPANGHLLTLPQSVTRDDSVLVFDRTELCEVVIQGAVLGALFIAALAKVQASTVGVHTWLWMGIVIATGIFGAWRLTSQALWKTLRVVPGDKAVMLQRRGRTIREIPFGDIAGYAVGLGKGTPFLTVVLRNGEVGLEVPSTALVWRRARGRVRMVRGIGPQLSGALSPIERPQNEIEGILFDHFNDPPPVAMRPGVTYRYVSPKDLAELVAGHDRELLVAVAFVTLLQTFQSFLARGSFPWATFVTGTAVCVAWTAYTLASPRAKLRNSIDDRFERTPEGLRVTRKNRSWVVRDPRWATGFGRSFCVADTPVLRFREGAYYFDPRFIEPDV